MHPDTGHITDDACESASANETWNVFQENEPRSNHANRSPDGIPQPSFILKPSPLPSDAVRLAGESCSDEIHSPTPREAIEGFNIVPYRRLIQVLRFHPGHEHSCAVGLPFDSANKMVSGFSKPHPEIQPPHARAQSKGTHHHT
jgi:hypothetical protein